MYLILFWIHENFNNIYFFATSFLHLKHNMRILKCFLASFYDPETYLLIKIKFKIYAISIKIEQCMFVVDIYTWETTNKSSNKLI